MGLLLAQEERFADEETARRCLAQVDWQLEPAMALYMPPVPDSPVSGRELASSHFKAAYDKATPPKGAPREWKPWGVRDYDPIYNADGSYAKHW